MTTHELQALLFVMNRRNMLCGDNGIRNKIDMAQATTSARAPRGTKVLTQAFFSAADAIPEPQRTTVIKAALAAIRDELKAVREKAAAARAKAKSASSAKKAAGKPVKKAAPKATTEMAVPVKAGGAKKMGRPVGSKNKPKVVEAPVVAAKKAAPKARAAKQAPIEQMAAE
jgi:hypothetical protein